jgi:hypothetical protein
MKIRTKMKVGTLPRNHNQTVVRSLKVKTHLKAGATGYFPDQHNQTLLRGLKVKTGLKAGLKEPGKIEVPN